jgi:hypothetical protein
MREQLAKQGLEAVNNSLSVSHSSIETEKWAR